MLIIQILRRHLLRLPSPSRFLYLRILRHLRSDMESTTQRFGFLTANSTGEFKLIVNHIPEEYDEEDLIRLFKPISYSSVRGPSFIGCNIVRHHHSGRSCGFGFVTYRNEDDAELAIRTLNETPHGSKIIKVSRSREGKGVGRGNVIVKMIPIGWTDRDVRNYVGQHHEVLSCRIVSDKKDNAFPMAYIRFDSRETALEAITQLHDYRFRDQYGNPVQLSLKLASEKEKKPKQNGGGKVIPPHRRRSFD